MTTTHATFTESNLIAGLVTFTNEGTKRYNKALAVFHSQVLQNGKSQEEAIVIALSSAVSDLANPEFRKNNALEAAGINTKPTVTEKVKNAARTATVAVTDKTKSIAQNHATKKTTKKKSTRTSIWGTPLVQAWVVVGALLGLIIGASFAMWAAPAWANANSDSAPSFVVGLLALVMAIAIPLLGLALGALIAFALASRSRVTETESESSTDTTLTENMKDLGIPHATTT